MDWNDYCSKEANRKMPNSIYMSAIVVQLERYKGIGTRSHEDTMSMYNSGMAPWGKIMSK